MKCEHADDADLGRTTDIRVCPSCVEAGDSWVQLRVCKVCGHVGCCDSSKNRHARRHFEETGHALARPGEPGWSWRGLAVVLRARLLRHPRRWGPV